VASAVVAGAALSLSGLLLQGMLRNPLASPFVLGLSGGAQAAGVEPSVAEVQAWVPERIAAGDTDALVDYRWLRRAVDLFRTAAFTATAKFPRIAWAVSASIRPRVRPRRA
jgi:hypothetical protein